MNRQILPVTKNLLIVNVIMFLFTYPLLAEQSVFTGLTGLPRNILAVYFPFGDTPFRPFQVVTSMFMHGGWWHLGFNMYALWMFGSFVEAALGPKRYFVYYLVSGFGALLLHWGMTVALGEPTNVPMLGASGAIYGLLVGFAFVSPNARLMLIFPPIPLKAKYFVLGLIAIDLFSGFTRVTSGVAHFAHVGGALAGFVLLLLWSRSGGLYRS